MTTKNKFYLTVTVLISLGVLLFLFLIQPVYQDIKAGSQELTSTKQKLASLESKINNIIDFKENYTEIKRNLEKSEKLFVNSKAPIAFISFLEESSRKSQCPITMFPSALQKDEKSLWPYIIFRIESVSSFPRFLKFFEKVESAPYLIEIKDLSIKKLTENDLKSKDLEGASLNDVQVSFSLKVFAK